MTIQEFNRFKQVWQIFLNSNPMTEEDLEFVCEQANLPIEQVKTILHKQFELWELSIDKVIDGS